MGNWELPVMEKQIANMKKTSKILIIDYFKISCEAMSNLQSSSAIVKNLNSVITYLTFGYKQQ